MPDAIVLCLADRLIEAAATAGGSNNVPKSNATMGKTTESLIVIERLQLLADGKTQQAPELIGRVRVIMSRRERGVARQAAKDEQSSVRSSDQR